MKKSHPVRGAWIEISNDKVDKLLEKSRTPSGVRGLKFVKFCLCRFIFKKSHPVRGAWIEIAIGSKMICKRQCRTPSGVRGLKYLSPRLL